MKSYFEKIHFILSQPNHKDIYTFFAKEYLSELTENEDMEGLAKAYIRLKKISEFTMIMYKYIAAHLLEYAEMEGLKKLEMDHCKLSFQARTTYKYPDDEYLQKLEGLKRELEQKIKNHEKFVQGLSNQPNSVRYLEDGDGNRYKIGSPISFTTPYIRFDKLRCNTHIKLDLKK